VKVLTLDLETAPQVAHVWGLWQQSDVLRLLLESGNVMCFAAKWEHEDKVLFHRGAQRKYKTTNRKKTPN
jgi:hypothetical protein